MPHTMQGIITSFHSVSVRTCHVVSRCNTWFVWKFYKKSICFDEGEKEVKTFGDNASMLPTLEGYDAGSVSLRICYTRYH